MTDLPTDVWSASWVVTRRDTGELVGEFYNDRIVRKFDPAIVLIETAHQYLTRTNREIARLAHRSIHSR